MTLSQALVRELSRCLKDGILLTNPYALDPYKRDALTAYQQRPKLVAIPASVDEAQAVLRFCHRHGVPLVPRGAGTGLSGGALPHPDAVLMSLAKLRRVKQVDATNRMVVAEPGVRNLTLSQLAAPFNLFYAPDPSSQVACTVGGNVAENAGGIHCLKYGLTVHNVLGLKWLTPAGELVSVGGRHFAQQGYDLLALMHGSEGLLGVIVEVTLRLIPKPAHRQVLLAGFNTVAQAANAVAALIKSGQIPAGLELMDRLAIEAAEAYVGAGYPLCEAILICELDGTQAVVDEEAADVQAIFNENGALSVQRATSQEACDKLWLGRKAAFPALGRIAPDYYCMDGTIPRSQLASVLAKIQELSVTYGLKVANVFHAGDGNLHPLILYDANDSEQLLKAEQFGAEILHSCLQAKGTITGEHGVGVEKIDQMCAQFTVAEIETFHAIKAVFDHRRLLNPNKAIPTLAHCVELGGMHVHEGRAGFAHLPRY